MNLNPKEFTSGVLMQPYDENDFIFSASPINLPSKFINEHIREIENQYSTNSCVAISACSSLEMMTKEEYNLSGLFVYYNAREPYSFLKEQDKGAYVRDGFKAINKFGVCSENKWKFKLGNVNLKPSIEAYESAVHNKIIKYERVMSIPAIKQAVYNKQAVIFGMMLTSDFIQIQGKLSTQDYKGNGYNIGGHAMSIVGYDDDIITSVGTGGFIVENSWGNTWGDNGLVFISYKFFEGMFDIWTASEIHFGSNKNKNKNHDDLIQLKGIGKAYRRYLNKENIFTFEDVVQMSDAQIEMMEHKYHFHGDFRDTIDHAKILINK